MSRSKDSKRLKTYQQLATANGSCDPLAYLFKRMNTHIRNQKPEKAEKLALMLVGYGHGKALPRTDDGEQVKDALVIIRGD